jgi:hypothetical protein
MIRRSKLSMRICYPFSKDSENYHSIIKSTAMPLEKAGNVEPPEAGHSESK